MNDPSKIKPVHTQRAALVYVRQSSLSQVEHNRESTARQYALADRACQLGWARDRYCLAILQEQEQPRISRNIKNSRIATAG